MKASDDPKFLSCQLPICISCWGERAGCGTGKDGMQNGTEVKERPANMQAEKPAAKLSYNTETQEKLGMGICILAVSTYWESKMSAWLKTCLRT